MATALPALPQSNWVDPKTGISYGVPAGYDDIWPSIPDDARELFIKTSKGTRESYAAAKREQLNNPQEWAKRQARVDLAAANPQFEFKSKPVLSPEQKLRLGLDTTPNAFLGNTRYANGSLITEIDPSALDNIYLLTRVLAQEASVQKSLAALGREAAPGIERLRMQFLAIKSAKQAVLEMTFTQDQRKFLQDMEAESKKIAKLLAGALPEVVIFGRNVNESSTIADLLSKAGAEAEKRPRSIADPEGGPEFIKEHPIAIVIDPDLEGDGRRVKIGIADRSGEGQNQSRMTHDQIANAMGSSFSEVITGFIQVKKIYDADGKFLRTELVFDFANHPPALNGKVRDHVEWTRWLRELAAHPEARLLSGAALMIQGHVRQIEPGQKLHWRFEAGSNILVSFKAPEIKAPESKAPNYFPSKPPRGPFDSSRHEQMRTEGNIARDTEAPPTPDAPPPPKPREQGPSNPDLEARIRTLLDNTPLSQLENDVNTKNPRIFKDELFRTGDNNERIRAFKRVLAEPRYRGHSAALGNLRREIIFQLAEEIARFHNIPIELIDSGKTNGFLSDLDLTFYVPPESRGNISSLAVIEHFERAFKALTGIDHGNIDTTIHDGDLFMPDPRYTNQSFEEYSVSLHEVLKGLRDKAASKKGPDGKIIPGQDLHLDPDSNRKIVQGRHLREGRVTKFTPTPDGTTVKRATGPVSQLSWRPGGGWDINSSRLSNVNPTFDGSDRFGILLENLNHMAKNGQDHAALAKDFMRAINLGIGSGMVNSYSDLHGSAQSVPSGPIAPQAPGDDVIRLALELESGVRTSDEAKINTGPSKNAGPIEFTNRRMAKLRWIIRAFGLARPAAPHWTGNAGNLQRVSPPPPDFSAHDVKHVRKLFELIEIAAEMEALKNRGEFRFDNAELNTGRGIWMRNYFQDAEKAVRSRPSSKGLTDKEFADAVYAEAWRYYTLELKDTVVKSMAVAIKRVLFDLTPQGMRRNAMQFALPDGRVDLQAAKKLAQQRREQLAILHESIASLIRAGQAAAKTPAEFASAQDARILAESLRAGVLNKIDDQVLRRHIEKLATLTEAQFENFLLEIAPSDLEIEKILSAKEGKLRAIDEPIDMSESRKFADYMRDGILRRYSPADGPSLLQSLDRMNNIIGDLLSLTSRENPAAAPLLRERYGHANSHFPGVAMLGNSLVTVSQAYASGDDLAFREALLGEFFNYFLPPAYGVITTALTHSRRNKVQQGLISVGTLGVFHLLEAAAPGAGQIIMAFQLVNGLPKLVETITREAFTDDILEQALQSNPPINRDGGLGQKRAERNPYTVQLFRDIRPQVIDGVVIRNRKKEIPLTLPGTQLLREAAKSSPPFEPVLFRYNACGDPRSAGWPAAPRLTLEVPEDFMTMEEKLPLAQRLFGPEIEMKIAEVGLSPEDIAASSDPALKQGHAEWLRQGLLNEYAFALPYERRIARLYDCFFPKMHEKRKEYQANSALSSLDEDAVLEKMFLEIVDEWFSKQGPAYQEEFRFNSFTDHLNPWFDPEKNSQRLRKAIAMKIVSLYKRSEAFALYGGEREKEIRSSLASNITRAEIIQEQFFGKRTTLVKRSGDALEALSVRNFSTLKPQEPVAWLETPPYYVPFTDLQASPAAHSPIVANIRVDPKRYPAPYQADYTVSVARCTTDWQSLLPGLRLSNAEMQRLDQKSPAGRPLNRLLAVQFDASADMKDAAGRRIVTTNTVPVKGYVIEPAPSFTGNVKLHLKGDHPRDGVLRMSGRVFINGKEHTDKSDDEHISVYAPGAYTIEIDPRHPEWGRASASFSFPEPQVDNNSCIRSDSVAATEVTINFPYIKPSEANTNSPTGLRSAITPSGSSVAACQQLITSAKQQGASNPSAAAQAQQKCAGVSPAVDQGLQGLTSDLAAAINAGMQNCEFEQALQIASQGKPALQANPQLASWLNANLPGLEARALAQSQARTLLRQAQDAIQRKDIKASLAALDQALAIPNLPQCMKDQITSARGPLLTHNKFTELVTALVAAYDRCDVATTLSLRSQIDALQPRDAMMNSWFAQNTRASLDDWARRYQRSLDLRTQALTLWRSASSTTDWDRVIASLDQARDTSLACLRALDIDRLIEEAKKRRPNPPTITTPTTTTSTVTPPITPPAKPAGLRWKLVSTDVVPKAHPGYVYAPDSTSVPMTVYNGDKGNFQWSAPPPEFDSTGFSMNLTVNANPVPNGGMAVLLCIGGSLQAEDRKTCAEANASKGAPASGSQTVKLKPLYSNGDVEIKVSIMWGAVTFLYKYQVVR